MNNIQPKDLKKQVHDYWDKESCGTEVTKEEKFSPSYFAQIEDFRYSIESSIFSFAQFTRFRNKKVLEVGVGAGTDFVQWVRAGALAYGVDLTQQAIDNARNRLALEGLEAKELRVADAENLPFPDNTFDLTYSWGVIHHSPNTIKCLDEIIRVTKPGGRIKVMVYNRRSLFAFYRYLLAGFLKGKIFKSFASILYEHQESPGTKAYTRKEIAEMIEAKPVSLASLDTTVTNHDLLYYKGRVARTFAYILACLWGWHRCGWFLTFELIKEKSA